MHKSRLPLRMWFWAVATETPGVSVRQLQRQLDLTRYDTAWAMLHKLRGSMVDPNRSDLSGLWKTMNSKSVESNTDAIAVNSPVRKRSRASLLVKLADGDPAVFASRSSPMLLDLPSAGSSSTMSHRVRPCTPMGGRATRHCSRRATNGLLATSVRLDER